MDPLVQIWRDVRRPLNWRAWAPLSPADQARHRWLLIDELRWIDACGNRLQSYHWRHAHRELLELKAACGHEAGREEPCAPVS